MIDIQIGSYEESQILFIYEDTDHTGLPVNAVFHAEFLESFPLYQDGRLIVYIGLGKRGELTARRMTDAVAKGVRELQKLHLSAAGINLSAMVPACGLSCVRSAVLGIKLGLYAYAPYRADSREDSFRFFLHGIPQSLQQTAQEYLGKAVNLADSVILARDLVNAPANRLTPPLMADALKKEAEKCGVQAEILDEKLAEALGMSAFLTVGNSSANPPRLIVLRYLADPQSSEITALVGKGVTCDTGGYCLKSRDSMLGIKGDMAGGAAVAGAIFALARNQVRTNAVAVIPACENRISRQSFLPGDVISSMSGKMIEIQNTDAEGRLILADAVTYAIRKEGAARVLDIATLTGAVVGALGFTTAGVLTDSDQLWEDLSAAARVSGEQYWRLPIFPEYEEMVKSKIADVKNMGEHYCGTISAGLFIREFAQRLPWIHLDIAGTAWVDKPVFEHQSVGATGAGVTTLYDLLNTQGQCSGQKI
ncbi:leucyl aminopeptidase [Caproiciproducens faecalis]|uniref:Probable cytosol aminopeptidase n=1 Tax=Caproiciproducens faecalis TaxID=2820301 RepID=A0ABS7DMW2_9FIRM|nr:leucyl aminopeptidase [Caproiciproducens faecalis]MBW7572644.1 leucyl aminopeptidase [Caproiciproducens faecalis]